MSDPERQEQQSSSENSTILVEHLLKRCHDLLNELEEFTAFLIDHKKENAVELRQFRHSVASELKSLEKLSNADPTAERTVHTLRSSNLPFYNAVWTAAKSCTSLVTFNKRFYWDAQPTRDAKRGAQPKRRSALVDIVAQDGAEWVKVSTITETRLLFELAKAGWECADSADDSGEEDEKWCSLDGAHAGRENGKDDDDGRVELVKLAEDLKKAASCVRVRYHHPTVRFVLPKLHAGNVPAIDSILDAIRATGAKIQCASDSPISTTPTTKDADTKSSLTTTFSHLLPHPFTHFTSTLNIDCTILLALVSDLSHLPISPEPWFHKAITRQIELEAREHLLPSSLYPALGGRDLVCTKEAAKRMREIVGCIGTPAEKARTNVVMGNVEMGPRELREEFARCSTHTVPADLELPIREVAAEGDKMKLPAIAQKVAEKLTAINRSVFLYGWNEGITTISSNRTVAKLIETTVEEEMEGEQEGGPHVWLCGTARSLVGKEKGRGVGRSGAGNNDDDGDGGHDGHG